MKSSWNAFSESSDSDFGLMIFKFDEDTAQSVAPLNKQELLLSPIEVPPHPTEKAPRAKTPKPKGIPKQQTKKTRSQDIINSESQNSIEKADIPHAPMFLDTVESPTVEKKRHHKKNAPGEKNSKKKRRNKKKKTKEEAPCDGKTKEKKHHRHTKRRRRSNSTKANVLKQNDQSTKATEHVPKSNEEPNPKLLPQSSDESEQKSIRIEEPTFLPPPPQAPQKVVRLTAGDAQSVAPRLSGSSKHRRTDAKSVRSTRPNRSSKSTRRKTSLAKIDPELNAVEATQVQSVPLKDTDLSKPEPVDGAVPGRSSVLDILTGGLVPTPASKIANVQPTRPDPLVTVDNTITVDVSGNAFETRGKHSKKKTKSNVNAPIPVQNWFTFQIAPVDEPDDVSIEKEATKQFDISFLLKKLKSTKI